MTTVAMFKLGTTNGIETMSSLEMVDYINASREAGSAEIAHSDFMKKVPKVLGKISDQFSGTSTYLVLGKKRQRDIYNFPRKEAMRMAMSYSYDLQEQILERWMYLEKEHDAQLKARSEARMEYRPMTAALVEFRSDAGKETKAHHFSNEADLINRIVLGSPASKFRVSNEIEKDEALRDFLTKQQIIAIQHLQKTNTALIEIGMDFQERKDRLTTIYDKKHNQLLIDEQLKLEA